MISPQQLEVLAGAVGDDALEPHPPLELEGARLSATLRPRDGAALRRALAALGRCGLAAIVRGGGTRLGLGNRPSRADVLLSTERLAGVVEFDPSEGVCQLRAGTALADARAELNAGGWELPLDPPGARASVGGALATAAVGPRAQGFGLPRDLVLGLEVALASGERARCGGRVVKNVTGYDLNKLYTGSLGTLGVIEAAWLRLRPLPERVATFEAYVSGVAEAAESGLLAARRPAARAAAIVDRPERADEEGVAAFRVVVELAGDAASVEHDAAWLERRLGAREVDAATLDGVRELQGQMPGAAGLRFRVAALPSRLPRTLGGLRAAGARLLAYPGLGLVYAGFAVSDPGDGAEVDAIFRRAARAAGDGAGSYLCEAAPDLAKAGRDVFGDVSGSLALIRALKSRFDPDGVLNPGRFAGGI